MTKRDIQLTRRKALAGAGAIGFATVGMGRGRPTASWDEYTDYTYAESDAPSRLVVGWRSVYNDALVGESPTDSIDSVDEIDGGIRLVDLDDVLPGDTGSASVGLRLDDEGGMVPDGARVWMQIAEPEGVSLFEDPASRALADRIEIDIRYDTGLLGVRRCAGAEDQFVHFGEEIFSGTVDGLVSGDVAAGIELDPGLLDNGCLTPEERRCLTFVWRFPTGGGNAGKGGTIDFDVTFHAVSCEVTENPFKNVNGVA